MAELPLRWVVVCENESDAVIACGLADRVAREPEEDIPAQVRGDLDTHRRWSGDVADSATDGRPLRWARVKDRAKALGIAPHGYGARSAGLAGVESAEIRKVVAVVTRKGVEHPAGILLVRDTDADAERRRSYRVSVDALNMSERRSPTPLRVVLAMPHPEIEAWLLAGFEPDDDGERARLRAVRTRLGKDPCERSHELNPGRTATEVGRVKNSTKNALDDLCGDDHGRKRRCWEGAPLALLLRRGEHNGLVEFIADVRAQYLASLKSFG